MRGWLDFIIDEGSEPPQFRECKGFVALILVQKIQ
jgi:hypothetical protein